MAAPVTHRPPRRLLFAVVTAVAIAFPLGAIASHQFLDVPDSNPFHADIDALADSGVTSGCGGGNYCPSANVTREQMAAFLNRLGALAPNKTPVVNATKLDGYDANALSRIAWSRENDTVALTYQANDPEIYGEVTISAPVAGFVHVIGSATVTAVLCVNRCTAIGSLFHVETSSRGQWAEATVPVAGDFGAMAWTSVFPVSAGTNTFRILLSETNLSADMAGYWSEITAQFVPFEGSGLSVLPFGSAVAPVVDPSSKSVQP